MGAYVKCDFSSFKTFFNQMKNAGDEFKKDYKTWLDAVGEEFLKEVQEQVISTGAMDTGYMLHTFERGNKDNLWNMKADLGAIQLEVGTILEYAVYANCGHRTLDPAKGKYFLLPNGEKARFVPGYWNADKFIYDPSADGGMVLKYHWVDGKYFFDRAIENFAPQFEKSFEKKLEEWLAKYF